MNYWAIICEEPDLPGLWNKWQQENVVTISFGTPEYLEKHPELRSPTGGYGFAEHLIKQMEPGDHIIPFLKENRIGRLATFRRQRIDEWVPIWRGNHGRRIEVVWQTDNMPPPEKVALIPQELRKPIRRTVTRLSPERFEELLQVLANPDNWQDLPVVRESTDEEGEEPPDEARFVLESHLEEFIEANFAHVNFGRRLELYQDEDNTGRQFPTSIGSVDLLARDVDSGEFIVIELKKNRTDDQVVGQILRYMGWVREHMAGAGGSVSGIIIVPEVSDRLRYALRMVSNVRLFTYSVSFGVNPVI